ncbi:PQQ-binding-like beta-propeller repeat protein [Gimesia aquarii]|uniref:outer membrane protein assembly factor BamB family protein n=1 Tax=Gimesia aquarii TaxID=2527964 RepID=UPI0018D6B0F5|nr:PQQ-binding-like beta-propeller repeat protein [Gimesia aquarii]
MATFSVPCSAQPLRNLDQSELQNFFPTSRTYSKSYQEALKLIGEEKYAISIPELQKVLEAPEDYIFSKKDSGFVSLKHLAQQSMAELPPEGKRIYSQQYGATAEQLLIQAKEQHDVNLLQDVVRRYFFTIAGANAAYSLGAYYFERGDFWAAIQQWDALRNQHDLAGTKEPHLTFKLAVCWYHIGNLGKSRQALMRLARLTQGEAYQFPNGKRVPLFTADENPVEWLSRLVGNPDLKAAQEQKSWAMYRGGPSRLASARFAVPSTKPFWRFSTINHSSRNDLQAAPLLEELVQKLRKHRRKHFEGVLPAASPIIVNDKVIFRTHRNLKAVSLSTGELSWETTLTDALYHELLKDAENSDQEFSGAPQTPLEKYLAQRAWQDYTAGHLSSDGKLVFSVENVGFIGGFYHFTMRDKENIRVPKSFNRLIAFEVDSGKFMWEVGGPRLQNAIDYSGHYFLGPPLPLDGKLYCLAEEGREFRLLVLDSQTGKTLWTQSLYRSNNSIANDYTTDRRSVDHVRRRLGLSPSYAHGVIVCQTGSSCTIGIDAVNRRLLWRKLEEDGEIDPRLAVYSSMTYKNVEGWAEFAPIIVGDRVLIHSRKQQSIQCLNLFDGRLLWSRPRKDNLFVAAIHEGKILLVGNDQIEAIKVSDGSLAWPKSALIGAPSGRGVVVKDTYYQPVETGEILCIRLSDGFVLVRSQIKTATAIGNLVAAKGMIVSQNETEVVGFQSVESIWQQIRLASQSNRPDDLALAQLLRGELELYAGDVDQAMQKIEKSIQIKPTLRAKRLYAELLLSKLEYNFNQHQNQKAKIEKFLVNDKQKQQFFKILAINYQRQGNIEGAFQNYFRLSELKNVFHAEKTHAGSFVRMDRWIRAQIEFIAGRASSRQRALIRSLFSEYYTNYLVNAERSDLERFIYCCGNLPESQQVRVALIRLFEQAINESSETQQQQLHRKLMLHLEHLRTSKQPLMTAFATAKLAEIYLQLNRYSQAAELLKELETRWPDLICMDGKTAAQLVREWRSESDFQKWEQAHSSWPEDAAQVYQGEHPKGQNLSLPVELIGLSNSLFDNYRIEIGPAKEFLFAFDGQGKQQWAFPLIEAEIEVPGQPYFSARVYQQYLIVNFGSHFFVLDTLNASSTHPPELLWKQRMIAGPPSVRDYISIERNGQTPVLRDFLVRNMDRELLGKIGAVNEEFITYQIGNELIAAELLTGKILWKRQGIVNGSRHFGDADHVIVVASESFSSHSRYVLFSGQNGEVLRSFKLDEGESPKFAFNRFLLTETKEPRRLQLRDLTTGKAIWSQELSESSIYTLGQNYEVVLIDDERTISFLDLRTGEKQFNVKEKVSAQHTSVFMLQNSRQYLLFASQPFRRKKGVSYRLLSATSIGFNGGIVYSIDRKTGELMWSCPLESQGVDLSLFLDLPVIVFGRQTSNGHPSREGPQIDLQLVDLRSGKVILNETTRSNRSRIWIVPDVDRKNILVEPFQIRLSYEEPPVAAQKP